MKLNKLILLLTPLLLVGCSNIVDSDSSSTSIDESSSSGELSNDVTIIDPTTSDSSSSEIISSDLISNSDSSSSSDEYTIPLTLNNLYHVIYENRYLEGKETSSASYKSVSKSYYTTDECTTTYSEDLTMYKDYSYTIGSKNIKWTKSGSDTTKSYTKYRGVKDKYFYSIVDYNEDNSTTDMANYSSEDSASRYLIVDSSSPSDNEVSRNELEFNESMYVSYYALTYLNTSFNYVNQNKDVSYIVNNDNTLTYNVTYSYSDSDDYGSYNYNIEFSITIYKEDGFLKDLTYKLSQVNSNDISDIANEISNTYSIIRGNKSTSNVDYIDPTSYWMSDYEIGLKYADPNKMGHYIDCDLTKVPLNTYVYPYVKSVTPSNALDRDLKSESSSDSNIISVNSTYFYTGSTKGEATISVISEGGISKSTTIKVGDADITSINISLYKGSIDYRPNIFIGDELEIIYSIKPSGTISDLVWTSTDSNIGEVEIKNGVPYFIAKSAGTVSITASVNSNPSISSTISNIVVLEDTSVAQYLVGYSWKYLYSQDSFTNILTFNNDGTGVATITGSNSATINFSYEDKGNLTFKITPYPYGASKTYPYAICTLSNDYKSFKAEYYDDYDDYINFDTFTRVN